MTQIMKPEFLLETICSEYSNSRQITLYRLLSTAYLCDWRHSIVFNIPICSNKWEIIQNRVSNSDYLECVGAMDLFEFRQPEYNDILHLRRQPINFARQNTTERKIIDEVLRATIVSTDFQLDRQVISSFPFRFGNEIDMILLSKNFRNENPTNVSIPA